MGLRQERIKELLSKELVGDQNQIVALLKERYGIETNQAVISRDLRQLGVVKKSVNGVMVYEMPSIDIQIELLKLAVLDVVHNETTIVIKTRPALADFVGDCLDGYTDLEILGCIAGENTVFVAPRSNLKIKQIVQALCEKIQFKKIKDSYV
jgi:transcriptional regulator of arginine metabolism